MVIRRLSIQDFRSVFGLFTEAITGQFPEYACDIQESILYGKRYWNRDNYKKRLLDPGRLILGMFEKNELVGFLDAELPFAGVSLCVWIAVRPEYERQGIGSKLIRRWEKEMLKKHGHLLYLYSPERNREFYQNNGFSEAGIFKNGWFGLDDIIFTKQIHA